MAWSSQENHIQVIFFDQPIQVNVCERESRARAPVSEEPVLNVFRFERFFQQRIVLQINHAETQEITSPPVSVNITQLVCAQRFPLNGGSGWAVSAEGSAFRWCGHGKSTTVFDFDRFGGHSISPLVSHSIAAVAAFENVFDRPKHN